MKKQTEYDGEKGVVYNVTYAFIDKGDGLRCAWCEELVSEIKKTENIDKHLEEHL